MAGRVLIHPRAGIDIEEAAVHLGIEAPAVALRFLVSVDATLGALLVNPEMGSPRVTARRELSAIRSFPVRGFGNHLVFYRPIDADIEVVRVLHGARDLAAILDV